MRTRRVFRRVEAIVRAAMVLRCGTIEGRSVPAIATAIMLRLPRDVYGRLGRALDPTAVAEVLAASLVHIERSLVEPQRA